MPTIGIDAIALAVPEGYLDLADLAAARGVPAGKYVEGLGVAAHGGRARSMKTRWRWRPPRRGGCSPTSGVDPSTIGLCVVGTETAVDHSKPVAAYLHRLLGLPQQCRVFEAKHACFGGTAGLLAALDWIAAGSARGRKALIVCTDIARYGLQTPGEPTQGAGAVAILVSENPRLLALEVGVTGSYAQDVNDFWRPLYSKEAVVDGHHSVQCYLDALAGAYKGWQEASAATGNTDKLGASLLPRAVRQDGQEGAPPRHGARGRDRGRGRRQLRRRSGDVAAPAVAGRQHLHRLVVPGAGVAARGARRPSSRGSALASSATGRAAAPSTSRVASSRARARSPISSQLAAPLKDRTKYSFAEYEQIRLRDDEGDKRPVNGEAHGLPEGAIGFVGVDADRRIYVA